MTRHLAIGNQQLDLSRAIVMGILNVTPDSFSDGGKFNHIDKALEQSQRMIAEGAAIIDVGGESTRPGAAPVSEAEEIDRVRPVIEALSAEGALVSIDTRKPAVMEAAAAAGAGIINDVTGLTGDARSFDAAVALGLPLFEVYQVLIRLSMEGILQTSGDLSALQGLDVERREESVEETMQEAFAALDENDDEGQRQSAIDRVFGGDGADEGALGALDRVLGEGDEEQPSDVLGLLRRPKP